MTKETATNVLYRTLTIGPAAFWAATAADKLPFFGKDRMAQFAELFPPSLAVTFLVIIGLWQLGLAGLFSAAAFRGPNSRLFLHGIAGSMALFFFFLVGDRVTNNGMVMRHSLWALGTLGYAGLWIYIRETCKNTMAGTKEGASLRKLKPESNQAQAA